MDTKPENVFFDSNLKTIRDGEWKPWVQKMRLFETYKMSIWLYMFRWTIWKIWPKFKKKKKKKRGGGGLTSVICNACVHLNSTPWFFLLRSFPFQWEDLSVILPIIIMILPLSFPPPVLKNYATYHFDTLRHVMTLSNIEKI